MVQSFLVVLCFVLFLFVFLIFKPLPPVQKRFNGNASLDGSLTSIYPRVLERPLTKCAQCILKQKQLEKMLADQCSDSITGGSKQAESAVLLRVH